jgi:hypothetical protein
MRILQIGIRVLVAWNKDRPAGGKLKQIYNKLGQIICWALIIYEMFFNADYADYHENKSVKSA